MWCCVVYKKSDQVRAMESMSQAIYWSKTCMTLRRSYKCNKNFRAYKSDHLPNPMNINRSMILYDILKIVTFLRK